MEMRTFGTLAIGVAVRSEGRSEEMQDTNLGDPWTKIDHCADRYEASVLEQGTVVGRGMLPTMRLQMLSVVKL
jgi:hypothetical protein